MSTTCPGCGHENREDLRFCTQCGAPLAVVCPACGTPAEPGGQFCGHCGTALSPAAMPTSPPQAVPVAGEKKHITVLFADVAGSMDLQERLDAEVWAAIMGRFVSILAEGVRKYGGTVDKFTGDGIMALFGAPVAQEDHARRACHAAWALTRAIGEYSDELRRTHDVELQVRLGLNSGEVVVGRVGDDVTLDPTALGHTVGLAQRMEAMAEPGKAYLTEHTGRLVDGWFEVNDLGPRSVKGASAPLRVFALDGPLVQPGRPAVGAAPLVGRHREMAALDDALALATEGQAQVVGVVGEAGVGKSRLCEEFGRRAAERGAAVRRTTGVSHGRDVPLLPILSLLRGYFGVVDSDGPGEARDKITAGLLSLDGGLDDALPLLFDFLEVADPDRPAPRLSPVVRMDRLFSTFRQMTARRSERGVLVIIAEDLHWFDPQSENFLERLIESFPGTRTLVVTNFRPEFSAPWTRHSYYRQVPLAPLRGAAVGELLGGLLGVDLSLAPLLDFVRERTGGNPFFMEEVVRALVEDGTLAGEPGRYHLVRPVEDIGVPPTVQATLAARIDRLAAGDKALLQTAAVVGRNFSATLLVTISGGVEQDVRAALARLCATEFVQAAGFDRVDEYRFWHALTRDVAYGGLLADRRTALHDATAQALATDDPDRLDERAALIASHFEQAGNTVDAARWNDRAAAFAARSDVIDALRRWGELVRQLRSAPETAETLEIGIRARSRLIRYGARTGMDFAEAARLYAEAKELAERLGDPVQSATVTFAYASALFFAGEVVEGSARYFEAAALADQSGDAEAIAGYSVLRLWPPVFIGPVADGLAAAERVVTACNGDPDRGAAMLGFSPLSLLGPTEGELLWLRGQSDAARRSIDQSLAMARQRGETEWIAWNLATYARVADSAHDFTIGLERAREGFRVADESGNLLVRILARGAIGIAEVALGRFGEATETLLLAITEGRDHAVSLFEEARMLVNLARAQVGSGDRVVARRTADEAVEVAHRQGTRIFECLALLTRAQIWRTTGSADDTPVTDLQAALRLAQETGALVYERWIRQELNGTSAADAASLAP
jgi:class 3 adenylate cyclase/tetratricopeptide (TPR) repeat protein